MRALQTVAAVVVASGVVLAAPATAHADDVRAKQWYLQTLGVVEAHEQATGEGVTIGLVASGIDPNHQDIDGSVAVSQDFGQPAGPGNGPRSTGTADAAILAGHGHGENAGVLGIAPDAEIVSANVEGFGQPDQGVLIADAVNFLIEQQVDIISVSLPTANNEKLSVVVQQAAKQGIPVVGTASTTDTGELGFPVGTKGTINVVGSGQDGKAAQSNVPVPAEEEAVTMAAPSQQIPAAVPGNGYADGSSSSFATQIVAGTLALVKEKQPDLGSADLIAAVRDTASGEGEFGPALGYGIVDPVAALNASADTTDPASIGVTAGSKNTMLALIIAVAGVLALAVLVVVVRARDRSHRLALAGPAHESRPGAAPLSSNTGTMPRISDTGTMPRVSTGPGDTGTMPRVTDQPPGNHTPPYGQNPPGR